MKPKKIANKIKTSIHNRKQYQIFKSKQLIGLLIVIISTFFLAVSMVQVTGFTTLYAYTFGFLFGYYSYFILFALIYVGLSILFNIDIHIEKFIVKKYNRTLNFSWLVYLFFVIGIAMIVESSILISEENKLFLGDQMFDISLHDWWNDFTNSGNVNNAALPSTWNSGLLPSIFLSLIGSWSGLAFTIICGILFVFHFVFYIYFGSIIAIIRNSHTQKHKLKGQELVDHDTKILDLEFENDNNIIESKTDEDLVDFKKTVTISIDNVDNFFDVENPEIISENTQTDFLQMKTQEFNQQNNLIQDFNIEENLGVDQRLLNPETFEFELDIFDTITAPISNETITTEVNVENEEDTIRFEGQN